MPSSADVPVPQHVGPGKSIRWAVGSPDGPRSQVWNIKGHKSKRDVFIGVRDEMGTVKLSLHETKWRLAYTAEYHREFMPPERNRLIKSWPPSPELVEPGSGWRHALTIVVAMSMLGASSDDDPPQDRAVAWWPPPGPDRLVNFDVLVGDVDRGELVVNDHDGDVGLIDLVHDSVVRVVANYLSTDNQYEQQLADLRRFAADRLSWAYGTRDQYASPSIIDICSSDR